MLKSQHFIFTVGQLNIVNELLQKARRKMEGKHIHGMHFTTAIHRR